MIPKVSFLNSDPGDLEAGARAEESGWEEKKAAVPADAEEFLGFILLLPEHEAPNN